MIKIAERIRLFIGSTEITSYSKATITKTWDQIVNSANIDIEANSNVSIGDTIDFKKDDGSTTVFSAKIVEKKEENMWKLRLLSSGYELQNRLVQTVYTSTSPEAIVADVIDTYTTNLTDATTATSGVTITKYVANAYAIDVIKDMMDVLNWQLIIDESGNVTFEPKGTTNNGATFVHGTDIQITDWKEDNSVQFNRVQVRGQNLPFTAPQDTDTGDGTTKVYTLSHKPIGDVKITVDGTVQENTAPGELYAVDPENKQINFVTAPGNNLAITFDYEYHIPIIVDDQDDDSISTYGEIFRRVEAPWLDTYSEARKYSSNLLEVFSTPLTKVKATIPGLDWDRNVGEEILITDNIRNKSEVIVISKIVYDAAKNQTKIEGGERDYLFFDWQREVQERIKKLERKFQDEETVAVSRRLKHNMSVALTPTYINEKNSPMDSFIVGHETLDRLRADLNFEADCSDNGHNGTWSGTGIAGSQFLTNGWRLSTGIFNGSDRIITVTDDADLDLSGANFSIAFAIRVEELPSAEKYILNKWDGTDGYAIRITATNKIELIYSNNSTDSTIATTTALVAKDITHIVFVKEGTALTVYIDGSSDNTDTGTGNAGTNTEDFIVGKYSTNFFNGYIDEVRLYSSNLSSSDVTNLNNRITVTSNQKLYLSMDNPKLGDRSSVRTPTDNIITFFNTTLKDNSTTANWDTTNRRLAMTSETSKSKVYNTMALTKRLTEHGKSISSITVTSDENLWGNDIARYIISSDDGTNWEEVVKDVAYTPKYLGNQLKIRVIFIGNGGQDTSLTNLSWSITQ